MASFPHVSEEGHDGLEVVETRAEGFIECSERGAGRLAFVAVRAHGPTGGRPVRVLGPAAAEGDVLWLAVAPEVIVDELTAVVGVKTQEGVGQAGGAGSDGGAHMAWLRLGKATNITQRVLTSILSRLWKYPPRPESPQWTASSNSTRPGTSPLGTGAHGKAVLVEVAWPGRAAPTLCHLAWCSNLTAVAGLRLSSNGRVLASRRSPP